MADEYPWVKMRKDDIRVIVYPNPNHYQNSERQDYLDCESIREQIKRHVDNVASIEIVWDETRLCKYCGFEPSEDENGYPYCCDEAQKQADEMGIISVEDEEGDTNGKD